MEEDDSESDDSMTKLLSETPEDKPLTRARQYTIVFAVSTIQVLSRASDTLIYPFFATFGMNKGLTMTEVGVVYAGYDLSRFISAPLFGSILLKWPPKSMCAVGTLVSGLSCAGFGTLDLVHNRGWFLGLCILLRLIAGAGSSMVTVSAMSLLMKASGLRPTTVVGISEGAVGFAFVVGPVFGAALYGLVGYIAMFWLFGALMAGILPLYLLAVPRVVEKGKESKNFVDLMTIPGCFLVFLMTALTKASTAARYNRMGDYIYSMGGTPSLVGLLYGLWAIGYMVGCPLIARIITMFSRSLYWIMLLGWFLNAVCLLMIAPSPFLDFLYHGNRYIVNTAITTGAGAFVLALLNTPPFQAAQNLAAVNGHEKESLHTYGMISGLTTCGWALGATVGPVISGAIIDASNYEWSMQYFSFASIAMGLLLATYLIYMRLTKQPLSPEVCSNDSSEVETDQMKVCKQVADACNEQMNSCLNNSKHLTQIHLQQPPAE